MDEGNLSHLHAIELRLSHERDRAAAARNPKDKAFREHNIRMIERERASEIEFLAARGIVIEPSLPVDMTDEELLAALGRHYGPNGWS